MKTRTLLAAMLAIPAGIASAQTPTTSSTNTVPYLPLFSSGGNAQAGASANTTGNTASNSAWYIDTTRNLIVLCTQATTTASSSGANTGTAPSFACTAQAVPTSASTTGTSGTGSTGTGGTSSGGAGTNPMGQ